MSWLSPLALPSFLPPHSAGHDHLPRGRGGARDRNHEYASAATVREPRFRARQTAVRLLSERRGRVAPEAVVQMMGVKQK